MRGRSHKVEAVMADLAGRQKGSVTRSQLLAAGFGGDAIDRRIQRGSLHPQFPGVYLVGHRAEVRFAREYAALLYCKPRALLSHRTAARVRDWPVQERADIEVTLVGRQLRSRPGLQIYRVKSVLPSEIHFCEGMPITSPSLTLLDLGGVLGEASLAGCLNEARVHDQVTDEELHATLRAHRNRRGARALAKLLAREESEFAVESEAERLCLELMIEHGLGPDASQVRIGPYRVDFLYERERLIVEVDGFKYHRTRDRFIRDRRRRAHLLTLGYEVLSVTWADLTERPAGTMANVHRIRAARLRAIARTQRW
jgi:very-short-patch-repair endonuclease